MMITSINKEDSQRTQRLSKRENQVIALLAEGLSKHKIAECLNISKSTVATHLKHIYVKLNVSNAHGAIGKAFRNGLVS